LNPFYDYRGYLNCRAYGTLRAFGLFYYYLNCRAYGTYRHFQFSSREALNLCQFVDRYKASR
ncbi:MAG: hypothetical protein LHW62_05750, partial [Candidatus Cloacimonetes bacterium]|nr:hypothetical protein [Candidatus Cloacimonadota bacterium]